MDEYVEYVQLDEYVVKDGMLLDVCKNQYTGGKYTRNGHGYELVQDWTMKIEEVLEKHPEVMV